MFILRFKKHIRPACLWQTAAINYTKVVATGWGRIEYGLYIINLLNILNGLIYTFFSLEAGPKSDDLLKVVLDIIDNDNCASYIERDHRKLVNGLTEQQMCAGVLTGGKDTCQVSLVIRISISHNFMLKLYKFANMWFEPTLRKKKNRR